MHMEDRNALLQRLDEAHGKMQAVLAGLNQQMTIYPGWTIKHVLAHLIGWDEVATASLRAYTVGKEPGTPAIRSIDYYNAQSVATREALSYEQNAREWELAHTGLKAALRAVPAEKLDVPLLYPWGPKGTVAQLVAIFADHEEEHAREIQALKTRQAPRA